jgi:hypothetical protein
MFLAATPLLYNCQAAKRLFEDMQALVESRH